MTSIFSVIGGIYRPALLILIFFFSVPPSEAKYFLQGAGAMSCGRYIEIRSLNDRRINEMFENWFNGYASGVNTTQAIEDVRKLKILPDSASMLLFVDKFCRDNPLSQVWVGIHEILDQSPKYYNEK